MTLFPRRQITALVPVLGLLALPACATGPDPGQQAKVDAAVLGLSTAERLAAIYTKLPSCTAPKPVMLCSDPAIKQKIKDADQVAYNAVKAAENNPALLSLALDAVSNLQSVIPKVAPN